MTKATQSIGPQRGVGGAPVRRAAPPPVARRGGRGAFTIFEMLIVLLVIFVMMGLLLGGIRLVTKGTKATADRAEVNALQQASAQFKQQMGFGIPLVKDNGNLTAVGPPAQFDNLAPVLNGRVRVYLPSDSNELAFLRSKPPGADPDMRFSIYSIPIYLIGTADMARSAADQTPVDGVAGPGFRAVKRDGVFEASGRAFQPFFDFSKRANALYRLDEAAGKVVLRDRNEVAFRLYHWEHEAAVTMLDDLNVPDIVGRPEDDQRLRTAKYAIVGAGPDGVFGNESQLPIGHPQHLDINDVRRLLSLPGNAPLFPDIWNKASKDNIVEIIP